MLIVSLRSQNLVTPRVSYRKDSIETSEMIIIKKYAA